MPVQIRTPKGNNQQVLVANSADERVTHGQVIAVMDQLRSISRMLLAIVAATTREVRSEK